MSTTGDTWQTRPTLVEGLKRRSHRGSPASDVGALHATCIDCGASSHEWRRLLGTGARFFAAPGDAGRLVIQCASACGVCGSDALIVSAR